MILWWYLLRVFVMCVGLGVLTIRVVCLWRSVCVCSWSSPAADWRSFSAGIYSHWQDCPVSVSQQTWLLPWLHMLLTLAHLSAVILDSNNSPHWAASCKFLDRQALWLSVQLLFTTVDVSWAFKGKSQVYAILASLWFLCDSHLQLHLSNVLVETLNPAQSMLNQPMSVSHLCWLHSIISTISWLLL